MEIQSTVAYRYGNTLNCGLYIWKYTQLWPINMEIHSTIAYIYGNTLNCGLYIYGNTLNGCL